LIDIPANASGSMRAISRVSMSLMDATLPSWRTANTSSDISHFIHDTKTPRAFMVYPPAIADTPVLMEISTYPVDIPAPASDTALWSSVTGDISLADEWSTALLNVTLYYAYLTDLEGMSNPELAMSYRTMAEQIIGTQLQASVTAAKRDGDPT
jgi:hypothetical protein